MQKRVRLFSALLLGLAACGDEPPPLDLHEEELAVVFLGVGTDVEGLSCSGAGSCTVPDFARLDIRFTGTVVNGSVAGFQWRVLRPNRDPEPWQPFGSASRFLSAEKDTAAVSSPGDTLWALRNAVISVRLPAADPDSASSVGTLAIEARLLGSSGKVSVAEAGRREIQVVEPGPPQVLFVDVQNDRRGLQPCGSTGPCSVPYSAKLKLRVTASADFAHITGFQ